MFETLTKKSPPRQHVLKLLSMDPAYPDAPREGIRRMLEKVGPAAHFTQPLGTQGVVVPGPDQSGSSHQAAFIAGSPQGKSHSV